MDLGGAVGFHKVVFELPLQVVLHVSRHLSPFWWEHDDLEEEGRGLFLDDIDEERVVLAVVQAVVCVGVDLFLGGSLRPILTAFKALALLSLVAAALIIAPLAVLPGSVSSVTTVPIAIIVIAAVAFVLSVVVYPQ